MIIPTIGRIMWYWPEKQYRGKFPWAAIVTDVHDDNLVNVAIFSPNGNADDTKNSIRIVQDGSPNIADASSYVEWMPYQVDQTKRNKTNE